MKKKFLAPLIALALALSLAACGGSSAPDGSTPEDSAPQKDVDLTQFYSTLLEENEWPELMALEGEFLDSLYPGLSDLSLKQCLVNTAAISAVVGEVALVETETEEDAQAAADVFQARIDYQVGDESNPGGAWYPMSIEGWKNDSHIAANGSYVMLAVGEHAAEAVDSFNTLFA